GQLGNGTTANSNVPTAVMNLTVGDQVAAPSFSPEGGFYLQPQSVTVTCVTAGATIHYTTNGSDPTASDPIIGSGSSVSVANITFVRAKAFKTGYAPSVTKSGVYHIGGQIAAGLNHSLAVKPDGTLWAWGANNYGQLGIGSTVGKWSPVQVSGLSNTVAAAGGAYHSLAVKADGTVWGWGLNDYGQLGDGTTAIRWMAVRAIGVTNAVAIAAGQSHTLAVLRDGTVVAWGRNDNGQLGDRSFVQRNAPVVSTFTDAFAVAAGNHTLVLSWDGSIWGAGLNQNGQLGNGST